MEDASDECNIRGGQNKKYFRIAFDIVLWLGVGIPLLYLYLEGKPYERGFFCDDRDLSYPYKPDTVSNTALTVGGFAVSIFVILMAEVLNYIDKQCQRQCFTTVSLTKCVQMYAIFLVGFVAQQLLVEVGKNCLGVLRPNFFAVCRPLFNTSHCPGYISTYICTSTKPTEDLLDSRQSFPSGHSALSMYIAVFFSLYVQVNLRVRFSNILKFLVQYGLISTSLLCGLSRITDNKHHPTDVVAGFLVGASVAVAVFQLLGRKVTIEEPPTNTKSLFVSTIKHSLNCCDSKQKTDFEPQTPSPLLTHEYPNGVIDVMSQNCVITRETDKKKTLAIPLNVRRHFSTPITPSLRSEEI